MLFNIFGCFFYLPSRSGKFLIITRHAQRSSPRIIPSSFAPGQHPACKSSMQSTHIQLNMNDMNQKLRKKKIKLSLEAKLLLNC